MKRYAIIKDHYKDAAAQATEMAKAGWRLVGPAQPARDTLHYVFLTLENDTIEEGGPYRDPGNLIPLRTE